MARIAELGFDSVRFFLRWADFQPEPRRMDRTMLARLERVMELIAASRAARDADALLRPHERRELAAVVGARSGAPSGRFRTITETGESPYGSGDFYRGPLLRSAAAARARGRRRAARASGRGRVGSRQRVQQRAASRRRSRTRANGANGSPTICERASGHPVTGGIHGEDLTRDRNIRPSSICRTVGVRDDARLLGLQRFRARPHRPRRRAVPRRADRVALAEAGALQRVRQPDVPARRRSSGDRAAYACLDEAEMAAVRAGACSTGCTRRGGWAPTGGAGPTTPTTCAATPPFDRAPHELTFGIVRSDGSDEAGRRALFRLSRGKRAASSNPTIRRSSSRPTMRVSRRRRTTPTRDFWSSIFEDHPDHRRLLRVSDAPWRCRRHAPATRCTPSAATSARSRRSRVRVGEEGGTIATDVTDISDPANAPGLIGRAIGAYGHIDVLVNNAGAAASGPIAMQSDDALHAQFGTHVIGPLALVREALPTLRASRGHVFMIGSGVARVPVARHGRLSAVEGRACAARRRSCGANSSPLDIAVTYVDPGAVDTGFMTRAGMPGAPRESLVSPELVARKILLAIMTRPRVLNVTPLQTAAVALGGSVPGHRGSGARAQPVARRRRDRRSRRSRCSATTTAAARRSRCRAPASLPLLPDLEPEPEPEPYRTRTGSRSGRRRARTATSSRSR